MIYRNLFAEPGEGKKTFFSPSRPLVNRERDYFVVFANLLSLGCVRSHTAPLAGLDPRAPELCFHEEKRPSCSMMVPSSGIECSRYPSVHSTC